MKVKSRPRFLAMLTVVISPVMYIGYGKTQDMRKQEFDELRIESANLSGTVKGYPKQLRIHEDAFANDVEYLTVAELLDREKKAFAAFEADLKNCESAYAKFRRKTRALGWAYGRQLEKATQEDRELASVYREGLPIDRANALLPVIRLELRGLRSIRSRLSDLPKGRPPPDSLKTSAVKQLQETTMLMVVLQELVVRDVTCDSVAFEYLNEGLTECTQNLKIEFDAIQCSLDGKDSKLPNVQKGKSSAREEARLVTDKH